MLTHRLSRPPPRRRHRRNSLVIHRSDPSQTLADLSDYLAPSQACIKPVTYVPDEKAEVNELDKPAVAAAVRGVLSSESTRSCEAPADISPLAGRNHYWRGLELLRAGSRRREGQEAEKGRDHLERLPGLFVSVCVSVLLSLVWQVADEPTDPLRDLQGLHHFGRVGSGLASVARGGLSRSPRATSESNERLVHPRHPLMPLLSSRNSCL